MEKLQQIIIAMALIGSLAVMSSTANVLTCSETGMKFETNVTTNEHEYLNLLKLGQWGSNPVQRWRKWNGTTVSQCGNWEYIIMGPYGNWNIDMEYSKCAGDAIKLLQDFEVIKREAVVEIQLNQNWNETALRHLNYTQYKLTCEYTRQVNKSSSFNVTVKATVTELAKTMQSTFDTTMDLYESDQYKVIASSPQQVSLNQEIYVELNKTAADANLKINVWNCWATDTQSDVGYRLKYPLIHNACKMDPTLKITLKDDNILRFQLKSFIFTPSLPQIYLHCTLYICDKSNSNGECGPCLTRRKRRSIEGELSRERRAVSTAPLEMGRAVSSMIQYTAKPSCATLKCPSNSVCVENYPAFCRCNGNHVMDIHTTKCSDKNLVEMKVPTELKWLDQYKDQSTDLVRISKLYEDKMVDYYVKQQKVSGIKGMKVVSATQDSGKLTFKVMMTLAKEALMEKVSQQIQNLLVSKSEEVLEKTQVNPSTTIQILPVYIPASKKETGTDTQTFVIVGAGSLLVIIVIFAIFIKRRKREEPTKVVHVQGMEGVKVVPADNKAYAY